MRSVFVFFSVCVLALAGCGKSSPPPAPEPTPTPAPTATPTPEPTPEPINLNAQVVVLCYHRFEEKGGREMVITPEEFEAQLQTLKDEGIEVISMSDFLAWRRGEKNIPAKSAVITLDDGWVTGYNVAWPVLKKFDYPFTVFIYTDYVKGGPKAGGGSMTWEQLAEMRDAGVDIGGHTVTHSSLSARKGKSDEEYREWLRHELADSKKMLEQNLGIKVKTIAYPYGIHNETVREAVKEAGYEAGFTVYGQHLGHDGEAMQLGRYALDSMNPEVFKDKVLAFPNAGNASSGSAITTTSTIAGTQPMDGEMITNPSPEIKVNLSSLGNVDPESVTMRLSGIGLVPATYDPETKVLSYQTTQKFYAREVSVIVGAKVDGRRVETRWSFNVGPAPAEAAKEPGA